MKAPGLKMIYGVVRNIYIYTQRAEVLTNHAKVGEQRSGFSAAVDAAVVL
jgi:hypothetical protein